MSVLHPMKVVAAVLASFLLTSCASKPEPVVDQATVVAKNASLRLKNSSTSRTLRVLDTGEKVEVLERQDNWYRVRYGRRVYDHLVIATVERLIEETGGDLADLELVGVPDELTHDRMNAPRGSGSGG